MDDKISDVVATVKYAPELVRKVSLRPYQKGRGPRFRLELYDVCRCDRAGRHGVGYRLLQQNNEGERYRQLFDSLQSKRDTHVYTPRAVDSDDTVRAVLGFLTLRLGDTDREYFAEYTEVQREFRDEHAEALAAEVLWRFGE